MLIAVARSFEDAVGLMIWAWLFVMFVFWLIGVVKWLLGGRKEEPEDSGHDRWF